MICAGRMQMCPRHPAIVFVGGCSVQHNCYKGSPLAASTYTQARVQYYVSLLSPIVLVCFPTVMDPSALVTVEIAHNMYREHDRDLFAKCVMLIK